MCTTSWPACHVRSPQPGDQVGEGVVRDGEQHQLGPPTTSSGASTGTSRAAVRPHGLARLLADPGDRDDPVAHPLQGRAEHGAHPAGADHADVEARGTLIGRCHPDNLSRRHRVPETGSCAVLRGHDTASGYVGAVDWERAWHEALYGPSGFYRSPAGPAGHFTTATHGPTGSVLARALATLARERGLTHVVDVGAGRGELLAHLYAVEPALRLTGVDVVSRPAGLPDAVSWLDSPGGAGLPEALDELTQVLVVAHEWLDVVPCPVARVDEDGVLRRLHGRPGDRRGVPGAEPVAEPELGWVRAHWPGPEPR